MIYIFLVWEAYQIAQHSVQTLSAILFHNLATAIYSFIKAE